MGVGRSLVGGAKYSWFSYSFTHDLYLQLTDLNISIYGELHFCFRHILPAASSTHCCLNQSTSMLICITTNYAYVIHFRRISFLGSSRFDLAIGKYFNSLILF